MPAAMQTLALALALLPGLLVVRAPWTAVAAISLAFWTLTPWWPLFAGASRGRLLTAALAACALLSAMRLVPKHEVAPPPGYEPPPEPAVLPRPGLAPPPLASAPSLLVLGAALALLLPVPLWPHAPGPQLAFQTTAARLVMWRDALPRGLEPLLPLDAFGAHAPALATLAADVSLLTGIDPAPALVALVAAAAGLVVLGLYALDATWVEPWAAAVGTLVPLALVPWPGTLSLFGAGETFLALGFALPASTLLAGHASRSSAAAAALLYAASALAQPLVAALAGLLALAGSLRGGPRAERWRRAALTLLLALLLAAPGLLPLLRALSAREAAAIAASGQVSEIALLACFVLLAALAPRAFASLLASRRRSARPAAAAIAAAAAMLFAFRVHAWFAAGVLPESTRAALAHAAAATPPLATLCAPSHARDFVTALAGRRVGDPGPWIPALYAEEWVLRTRLACDVQLYAPFAR
jgi:hypothetical protein